MNILFLHRNFPGQFKHLVQELAKKNNVVFITSNKDVQIEGVRKLVYKLDDEVSANCHNFMKPYEEAVVHGCAASQKAQELKAEGFIPDVIYGHSWGVTMFMKDVFPNVPLICYFEWFYNDIDTDFDFILKNQRVEKHEELRCKNAYVLSDLCSCDVGISPTNWQKFQFPKEFYDKINVIHDGIDTDICKPDKDAKFEIKEKNIVLTTNDVVVTYATRGMEPYRGFPNFIKAAELIQKNRPNAQIVVAGVDKVFYGMELEGKSYKDIMLENSKLDMSRIHFVGKLAFDEYIRLLQVSSAHVYLTVPFVLSWSILEAMSVGCCVVASATQPVLEVVEDNQNGLLVDFFKVSEIVKAVDFALDKTESVRKIRENARKMVLENYSLKKLMPKHIELINSVIKSNKLS